MRLKVNLLLLAILLPVFANGADERKPVPVKVSTEYWLEFSGPNFTGYYFDLLHAIFPEPDFRLEPEILAYFVAVNKLNDKSTDIALGVYREDTRGHVSAQPVELEALVAVMSPERAANWQGIESMSGLRIGAMKGYAFASGLPSSVVYSEHDSIVAMMRMLSANRLDVVLEYKPDVEPVITEMGMPFVLESNLPRRNVYFAFRKDAKGLALKNRFDERFKGLLDSGEAWAMMKKNVEQAESNFPYTCTPKGCVLKYNN